MERKVSYLTNAWYAAALSTEVAGTAFFHRTLLDQSILLYRTQDGTAVALRDRCPHRFAPLHLGKRIGDEVSCLYHALRFDGTGTCTHNPHGSGDIPKAARVRAYPLVERYGFLWIWMGEAAPALEGLPDFGELDRGHPHGVAHTYMHLKANYELIIDNVMDLTHVDHVHGEIISTRGQLSPLTPKLKFGGASVSSRSEWKQTPPMMIFANFQPAPSTEARMFFDITWTPPATIQLSVGATQDDAPLDLTGCVGQYDLHTCTPETADSTHYFFATRRNHAVEDGDYNLAKIRAMHTAFETEDGPLLEAIHAEMKTTDFFSLNPVLMSNDAAPVKVRRLLKRLIEEESAGSDADHSPAAAQKHA